MNKISPKKSLGQNFLTDKKIAADIVDLLDLQIGDIVLEIGPGMGVLTEILLKKNVELTSVELDERAIVYLKEKFKTNTNFSLIKSDILVFNLPEFAAKWDKKIKVIGNIPYNISTEIFFMLFENASFIDKAVLTVQKEVAHRIAATTKQNKEYGITTVARSMTSSAKIAFDIAAGSFHPAPRVTSSVITLDFFAKQPAAELYNEIMKLVRSAFSQRRKVLKNALGSYLGFHGIEIAKFEEYLNFKNIIYFKQRAEELSLDDFLTLHEEIKKIKKENLLKQKV